MQRMLCGLRNWDKLGKERWRNTWGRHMVICISSSLTLTCVPFCFHLPSRTEWLKKWKFCSLGNASFYCVLKSGSDWRQTGGQEQYLTYSRAFFSGRRLQPSKSCTQMGRFTWRISRQKGPWRPSCSNSYIHIYTHMYTQIHPHQYMHIHLKFGKTTYILRKTCYWQIHSNTPKFTLFP